MRWPASKIFLYFNITFILVVFIIGFWPQTFLPNILSSKLAAHNGNSVQFIGWVCEEASVGISNRRLTICASGRVLVTTTLYPNYDYGDWLELRGNLQAPPIINSFDYESYLARHDIYSVMYYPSLSLIEGDLSWHQVAYKSLLVVKYRVKNMIDRHLPEPEAGLASAILLGYRRAISQEDLDIFARSGLSHIIAISGSHISILSALLIGTLISLGFNRKSALYATLIFLVTYPFLTGLSSSAVRAAIMGGLAMLALAVGRLRSTGRILIFAAAFMLAINPRLLRDDVGFQLSFLALFGLIYIYPLLISCFSRLIIIRGFWGLLISTTGMTLSVQLAILPISLVNFKQLSLLSPIANILVLWALAPLLASLILALFISFIIPAAGSWWFFIPHILLKFIFVVAEFLSTPTWAVIEVPNFTWLHGTVYYFFLILILTRKRWFNFFSH